MGTGVKRVEFPVAVIFKSHHSGMETRQIRSRGHSVRSALNRTIVGWKHDEIQDALDKRRDFKSHHGGMETAAKSLATHPTSAATLNRTIVGWKPARIDCSSLAVNIRL